MQHSKKQPKTLGVAFVFMSLAIIPFSLKAIGLHVSVSLSGALDTFTQMAGVFSTGYVSLPTVEWAGRQLSGDETGSTACDGLIACGDEPQDIAPELPALPEVENPAAAAPANDQNRDSCPLLHESCPLPRECPPVKARRPSSRLNSMASLAVPSSARVHIKLPFTPRELAEVLRWSPATRQVPEVSVDATILLRDRRVRLAEALKKYASHRDFESIVKMSTRCPQGTPAQRTPLPASSLNHTT